MNAQTLSIHNDIAKDIFDDKDLRINLPIGKINKMLDDDSEKKFRKNSSHGS